MFRGIKPLLCQLLLAVVDNYTVHSLSSAEQTECSLSLSSMSILRQAPCGRANSACLTSGTIWSTDINNTKFSSPCMIWPFDPHHEVHLCGWEHAENDFATGEGLQFMALPQRDQLTSEVTFSLSATCKIFINTTHHPLINYTPAKDAPLIINAFPINT